MLMSSEHEGLQSCPGIATQVEWARQKHMNMLDNDTELMPPPLSAPEIVCGNIRAAVRSF